MACRRVHRARVPGHLSISSQRPLGYLPAKLSSGRLAAAAGTRHRFRALRSEYSALDGPRTTDPLAEPAALARRRQRCRGGEAAWGLLLSVERDTLHRRSLEGLLDGG